MPEERIDASVPNDDRDKCVQKEANQTGPGIMLQKAGTVELPHLGSWIVSTVDRLSKAKPGDVQEIAASQIQLLTSYYDLVLGQARRSFRWALAAAVVGLGFFLAAVGFLLIRELPSVANISLISGSIIELISAINFYLYGKTSAQLAEFHTRLDRTQRFLLANSLCESLEGDFKQEARLELIRKIAGLESSEIEKPRSPNQ